MSGDKATPVTRAVRAAIATDLHHGAVVPPIHLSTNFTFAALGKPRRFDYTRSGNPTRAQLADAIAELEEGAGAVVTSTGMSAVLLVLQLLNPNDTVVAAHDCYGGTQRLLRSLATRGLCRVVFADLTAAEGGAAIAHERPTLVWIETPSNPLLRITDIATTAAAARAARALVAVDNTFLSPALQRPIAHGADLVVHSTTKYLNGHSDIVGGAVVAADAAVAANLAWWANCLGITGAPFDAYLTLRGTRTLFARMGHHVANTQEVVELLSAHPAVTRVYYPGLSGHPGHAIARRQQTAFGAMVSFELAGGPDAVEPFVNALRLFTLAESLGGVESLVAHPATMTHASMDADARAAAGIGDNLIRLSVGIESADDLVQDLRQALAACTVGRSPHVFAGAETRPAASVVLLGAGKVGRELIAQSCTRTHGGPSLIRTVGVVDSTGFVYDPSGLSIAQLRGIESHKAAGAPLASGTDGRAGSAAELIDILGAHDLPHPIIVDVTATDTHHVLRHAFARGWDAVLANKIPLADDQSRVDELWRDTAAHGASLRFEATVGAGLPVIDTIRKLQDSGDVVLAIEGCPSGTLGFLFAELGAGRAFSAALADAIALGLTEPDPRVDLSGADVARKALILGRMIGYRGDLGSIDVESLIPPPLAGVGAEAFVTRASEADALWSARVTRAAASGGVLRYRAHVTPTEITVGLVPVPSGAPLASLSGTDNQFAIATARYDRQPLVITGPGAGPGVTAGGVYADVRALAQFPRSLHHILATV